MDSASYLKRINYQKPISVNKVTLFGLQKAHLLTVPFENLDIHYDKKISLDLAAFFEKIVSNKRGGFCYELNGLFYKLLTTLGFNTKMIAAQVHRKEEKYGKEFGHLALVVNVDSQDFLVDVGFGKFSLEPLTINLGLKINDRFGIFQFDRYRDNYLRVNEFVKGELIPQYIFKEQERALSDFQEMCIFHQTNSDSHFTQKKVISIATNDGRITLNNTQFKLSKNEKTQETAIRESEFETYLKQYFDITIS